MSNLKTMYPISIPDNHLALKPLFSNTYSTNLEKRGFEWGLMASAAIVKKDH